MRHVIVGLLLVTATVLHAEDWVRFRGPNGQGISNEKNLPLKWSNSQNVAWKTPIPGKGWSSPIVYRNRIFLTTTTEKGVSCRVVCVNRVTGKVEWNTEVHRQKPGHKRRQNSYATSTPVTDGKRVYAVFYDGTAVAVDFTGKRVWKCEAVRHHSVHGLGASPIIANGMLIMPYDGSSRKSARVGFKIPWKNAVILGLDLETGDVRWRGKRGLSRVGHVTPILINKGQHFVSAGGDRVQAHDVTTGKRIWSIYSKGEGVTPSPVLGEGLLFTSSGFESPTIRAIRLGGKGDVTDTHIKWELKKGVPALASFIYLKPLLYTITRDNILHCIKASTGKIVWKKRLKGVHSASPVLVDGRIYITNEDGVTLIIRPGAKYDLIGKNDLEERVLASFAVSQGHFYVRSSKHLFSIGK